MISSFSVGVAFSFSIFGVLLSTPIIHKIGLKLGYFDQPGERKVHQKPIVRLGGIAISLATLIACLIAWLCGEFDTLPPNQVLEFWGVFGGGFLFFLIGLSDDLSDLSPFTRLLMQLFVASLVWVAGVRVEFLPLPHIGLIPLGFLSLPITVIWLTGVVNAINWMDGLDGLASGISGISASILLILCLWLNEPSIAVIAAALTGSTIGFLRYNFNPAQIFMGDGGSYFIGFTLASLSVIGLMKTTAASLFFLPFLILAVPILDMSFVILARLSDGKSPFYPDKRHLHHRLLQLGFSQRLTVILIYGLTLVVGCFSLAVIEVPGSVFYVVSAIALLGYLSWQGWQTTSYSR